MLPRLVQTVVALVLLLPFVVFQAVPELAPDWLSNPFLGVPATVWIVIILGYVGFMILIWYCMRGTDMDEEAS